MSAFRFARLAIACAVAATPVFAQSSPTQGGGNSQRHVSELERRSVFVVSGVQSRPLDELRRNIHFGYGAGGTYLFRVDRSGFLLLGIGAGYLEYGHETKHVPLSPTIGDRIQVDVTTTNSIVPASLGAELTWPRGRIRPYVDAGLGAQFFTTTSSIDDTDLESDFSTTNQHDFSWSQVVGGGVYVPVSTNHNGTHVSIDLGVERYSGGHAHYLRPGSIQDLPGGQTVITTLESDTHMLLVRLGVRIGR